MNKTLKKLRSRNLLSNFKQFLSVILIVLLSTTLLSGFIVNSHTLSKSIDTYFEKTNLADLWVNTSVVLENDELFFDENNIDYCNRLYFETSAFIENKNAEGNSKIYVSNGKFSTPYVETGSKKNACLIDKNLAKTLGVSVGIDNLTFSFDYVVAGNAVPIELEFRITGTMSMSECAVANSAWQIFIDEQIFLTKLNKVLSDNSIPALSKLPYNQVLIKTNDIELTKNKLEMYYSALNNDYFYIFDKNSLESIVLLESEVQQSKKMIYIFPIIFLIVSVFVILTTISQLIIQEKTKIGTLKSIGVNDKKILKHYSSYGAYLCGIGAILGVLMGLLIVPNIMFVKYDMLYSLPEEYVKLSPPVLILICVIVGIVLLGYLVSLFACLNILHKKPIECLRPDITMKINTNGKGSKLKRLPLSVKMALRNLKMKPVRTIMATLGIAGSVALLVCGFGIGDTLQYSLKNDLGKLYNYDISTTYSTEDFESKIQDVSGVDYFEKYSSYLTETVFNNKISNVVVYEIADNSQIVNLNLTGGKVYLSKSVADDMNIKVGDNVLVSVAGKTENLTIDGIIKTSFFNGIYTSKNLSFDETFATKGMWINCLQNPQEITQEINDINGTNSAKTMQQMIDSANEKMTSIDSMTTTLIVFAVMLAVVVLLNLIFLILKERTKDIATLKVLGESLMSVTLSLFLEILTMTIVGLLFGMALGFPLMVWVLSVNKVQIMNFLMHIDFISFLWSALVVFATILVVIALTVFKIKKVNMIESLKTIE